MSENHFSNHCNTPSHQVLTHSIVMLFPPHWKQAVTKLLDNHCLLLNPLVAKWETVLTVSSLLIVSSLDKEPRYLHVHVQRSCQLAPSIQLLPTWGTVLTQNKTSRGEVGSFIQKKQLPLIIIIIIIIIILIIIIGCGRTYCNIFCFCSELSAITLHILKTDTQVNNVFWHFSLNQLRLKKGR